MDKKTSIIVASLRKEIGSLRRVQKTHTDAFAVVQDNAEVTVQALVRLADVLEAVGRTMTRIDKRVAAVEKQRRRGRGR